MNIRHLPHLSLLLTALLLVPLAAHSAD